jgi:hypothetical protein
MMILMSQKEIDKGDPSMQKDRDDTSPVFHHSGTYSPRHSVIIINHFPLFEEPVQTMPEVLVHDVSGYPNSLLAVSAISGHADFRVLCNRSTIQSGTRSCEIVYNGSRSHNGTNKVLHIARFFL